MAELFMKNGKQWQREKVKCTRCGGSGIFFVAVHNGVGVPAQPDAGVCYRCHGSGFEIEERRVLTEKEQAQREMARARKAARKEQERAEKAVQWEAERKAREEEKSRKEKEREDRIAALRAISQYQGEVGDKVTIEVTLKKYFNFDTQFGTKYIYLFEDNHQNIYKWSSTKTFPQGEGDPLTITGTIKEHEEYNGQKQTVLTRCKVK